MSCEIYKSRITNAAAATDEVPLDSELAVHLKTCAACRAELDAQLALLASIDRGLAAMVQEEPSGDFAAHVRRRIAEKVAGQRPWFAGWLPVSAAAVALLAVMVWVINRPPRPPQSVRVTSAPVAPADKPREAALPVEAARKEAPPSVAVGPRRPLGGQLASNQEPGVRVGRPPRPGQMAANREPEVLVPRGEMAAVMRLFNANWNGKADGASLTAQATPMREALKPMTIDQMKIPSLEIVPLESGEPPKGSPEK